MWIRAAAHLSAANGIQPSGWRRFCAALLIALGFCFQVLDGRRQDALLDQVIQRELCVRKIGFAKLLCSAASWICGVWKVESDTSGSLDQARDRLLLVLAVAVLLSC